MALHTVKLYIHIRIMDKQWKQNYEEEYEYRKGVHIVKIVYNFDSLGNEIERKATRLVGIPLVSIRSSKYKYDNIGNWIEKIVYYDNIPKFVVEREYKYF